MNEFQEIRARYRWQALLTGVPAFAVVAVVAGFVGALVGFSLLVIFFGYALAVIVAAEVDFGVILEALVLGGAGSGVAVLVLGTPLLLVVGDRLGPWAVGAKPADPAHPDQHAIVDSFRTVGLAAGVDPIVYLVEGNWVNVAGLGRRADRPVLVTTTGAARLARPDREVIAAIGLSDALLGGVAVRLWQSGRAALIVPFLVLHRFRWPILALWLGQLPALAFAVHPVAALLPLFMSWFVFLPLAFVAVGLFVAQLVLGLIGSRYRATADVGAMALLRHPEQWFEAMIVFSRWKWAMGADLRLFHLDWLVPTLRRRFARRTRKLQRAIPAVGRRLGEVRFPEWLDLDLWMEDPAGEDYRRLESRWRRGDDLPEPERRQRPASRLPSWELGGRRPRSRSG